MNKNLELTDEYFMTEALKEARKAILHDDVPIGAVIVYENRIIAKAHNLVEKKRDATRHAEVVSINKAIKKMGYKHLNDCTLYVTVEPCSMCAGAIILSRIKRVVYATEDLKAGACNSLYELLHDSRLNHQCKVSSGVLKQESQELISGFFSDIRKRKKKSL